MADRERFQAFCRICYAAIERDTLAEAIQAAEEHERRMEQMARQGLVHPRTHKEIRPEPSAA